MQGLIASIWAGSTTLAAPALRLMLRRRLHRGKEIANRLPEREGIDATPRPEGRLIWLHAASVGETQSVFPLLQELAAKGLAILITTGTITSARLFEERRAPLGLETILHRFVPLDVPGWIARFLDHWRPDAAIFVESELWPNTIAACQHRQIPLMLINARMSARSLAAWRRAPAFARQVLAAFTRIHPQSAADASRLQSLGAQSLDPPGNLKLAAPPLPADPAELARLRALLANRPAWLAASTHPGEEEIAAQVHATLAPTPPGLVTIIAPRHPERGPAIAQTLDAPRRAAGQDLPPGGIWIADTLGELGLLYRLAPIVFIGRSLAGRGGQNPLEPARLGCVLAAGPHMGNFEEPEHRLTKAGALTTVHDAHALAAWVARMLADPTARQTAGTAAQATSQGEENLPARLAEAIAHLAAKTSS